MSNLHGLTRRISSLTDHLAVEKKPACCTIGYSEVECGINHSKPEEHRECIMNDQPHIREKLAHYHAMGVNISLWMPFVDEETE